MAKPENRGAELTKCVRSRRDRQRAWLREGEPTVVRQLARVGVLGWLIIGPALLGGWLGRMLDRAAGTEVFWSAPLLLAGLSLGCWFGWKWMHSP